LGCASVASIWGLVERDQLPSVNLGWFTLEGKIRAGEIFNLSDKNATFVTGDTFLVVSVRRVVKGKKG
jgi:hypothetical protein